jgi:hypothetical protein
MKDYIKHLYNIKETELPLIGCIMKVTKEIKTSGVTTEQSQYYKKVYKRKSKLLGLNISLKGRLKGARRARRLLHN